MTGPKGYGIKASKTRGLKIPVRCSFCGSSAENVWYMFQSADGKSNICDECLNAMSMFILRKFMETEEGKESDGNAGN